MPTTERGEPRKVGVEIEYTGLGLRETAELVQRIFGGRIVRRSEYDYCVGHTGPGTFEINADMGYLRRLGEEQERLGERPAYQQVVARLAEKISPFEIATPPLFPADMGRMDALVTLMGQRGARGTRANLLAAFGVHFNPLVPSLESESLHRYLRAFAVLYPWLVESLGVDLSRRVTPFVDAYPRSYVGLLLSSDRAPSRTRLIADYLEHNPTRNRALDMCPLFAFLAPDLVQRMVRDERVKARPTFHYRLPNSHVGEHGWSLSDEWRSWLLVEHLAHQPRRLRILAAEARGLLQQGEARRAWLRMIESEAGDLLAWVGMRPRGVLAAERLVEAEERG